MQQQRLELREENFIRYLIEGGVLQSIDWGIIAKAHGHLPSRCVIFDCPDCDQRKRWRDYLTLTAKEMNPGFSLHPFSLNGGGLLLPEESPINVDGEDGRVLMRHALESFGIKEDLGLVLVTSHLRCAKAIASGISTPEKIPLTLLGARRVSGEISTLGKEGIQVASMLMVNYGKWIPDSSVWGMRSYHLNKSAWLEWLHEKGENIIMANYGDEVRARTMNYSAALSNNKVVAA